MESLERACIILIILVCLSLCIPTPSKNKEDTYLINHDGAYLLSSVDKEKITPLFMYSDPEWAYYQCRADKENYERRDWLAVNTGLRKFTCGKYYGGEI